MKPSKIDLNTSETTVQVRGRWVFDLLFTCISTLTSTNQRSIRHHLSLNQVFRNTPKPITELGKGSYWELDITRGEAYKRRNKKARPQAQAAPDQESESESASDEEFGSDTSSITAGEIPDWDVASTAADKADS